MTTCNDLPVTLHPTFPTVGFENIDCSINMFFINKKHRKEPPVGEICLYSDQQKQIDYMLFENGRLLLISQQDADQFSNNLHLYSLKSGVFLNDPTRKIGDAETPLLAQAKF